MNRRRDVTRGFLGPAVILMWCSACAVVQPPVRGIPERPTDSWRDFRQLGLEPGSPLRIHVEPGGFARVVTGSLTAAREWKTGVKVDGKLADLGDSELVLIPEEAAQQRWRFRVGDIAAVEARVPFDDSLKNGLLIGAGSGAAAAALYGASHAEIDAADFGNLAISAGLGALVGVLVDQGFRGERIAELYKRRADGKDSAPEH